MRIIVVGAGGTVGRAVCGELGKRHDIIRAGRSHGDVRVDLAERASIEAMYAKVGEVDAVACCAGAVRYVPLADMTEDQFKLGLSNKLMGQVNLVLAGMAHLNDGGSFTLIGGIPDRDPVRQGTSASTVDAALNGFALSAAIELPRGLRVNVVSPGLLEESAGHYGHLFPGHEPVSTVRVGLAYAKSIEGGLTGQVIAVG
jgi:NAD(P)-dependent dehydrogenase (short-subunit alcohol dehydrogenase family)